MRFNAANLLLSLFYQIASLIRKQPTPGKQKYLLNHLKIFDKYCEFIYFNRIFNIVLFITIQIKIIGILYLMLLLCMILCYYF